MALTLEQMRANVTGMQTWLDQHPVNVSDPADAQQTRALVRAALNTAQARVNAASGGDPGAVDAAAQAFDQAAGAYHAYATTADSLEAAQAAGGGFLGQLSDILRSAGLLIGVGVAAWLVLTHRKRAA